MTVLPKHDAREKIVVLTTVMDHQPAPQRMINFCNFPFSDFQDYRPIRFLYFLCKFWFDVGSVEKVSGTMNICSKFNKIPTICYSCIMIKITILIMLF